MGRRRAEADEAEQQQQQAGRWQQHRRVAAGGPRRFRPATVTDQRPTLQPALPGQHRRQQRTSAAALHRNRHPMAATSAACRAPSPSCGSSGGAVGRATARHGHRTAAAPRPAMITDATPSPQPAVRLLPPAPRPIAAAKSCCCSRNSPQTPAAPAVPPCCVSSARCSAASRQPTPTSDDAAPRLPPPVRWRRRESVQVTPQPCGPAPARRCHLQACGNHPECGLGERGRALTARRGTAGRRRGASTWRS